MKSSDENVEQSKRKDKIDIESEECPNTKTVKISIQPEARKIAKKMAVDAAADALKRRIISRVLQNQFYNNTDEARIYSFCIPEHKKPKEQEKAENDKQLCVLSHYTAFASPTDPIISRFSGFDGDETRSAMEAALIDPSVLEMFGQYQSLLGEHMVTKNSAMKIVWQWCRESCQKKVPDQLIQLISNRSKKQVIAPANIEIKRRPSVIPSSPSKKGKKNFPQKKKSVAEPPRKEVSHDVGNNEQQLVNELRSLVEGVTIDDVQRYLRGALWQGEADVRRMMRFKVMLILGAIDEHQQEERNFDNAVTQDETAIDRYEYEFCRSFMEAFVYPWYLRKVEEDALCQSAERSSCSAELSPVLVNSNNAKKIRRLIRLPDELALVYLRTSA